MRIITKSFLKIWYVKKGLSTWSIEKRFGVTRSRVYAALKKYKISTRSIAQSHIRYARSDFSGDKIEKAYLVGFAIGDLRVRDHNGAKSETISIGCGSTHAEQIQLIEKLFSNYGRVWKGKPDKRGAVNIEAFVNKTFSFLLKEKKVYKECARNKKEFFAFLAGFTDAEGSFFVSNNKARIAWGNYDETILRFIKNNLVKYDIITPKLYNDSLQGTMGTHGYIRNKNYFHLVCNKKQIAAKLLVELEPFVHHEGKKRAMACVRKNLIMRGVII